MKDKDEKNETEVEAEKRTGEGIATEREVLEALTRILRRAETEDAVGKLRTETRSTDGDGRA